MSIEKCPQPSALGSTGLNGGSSVRGGRNPEAAGETNTNSDSFGSVLADIHSEDMEAIAVSDAQPESAKDLDTAIVNVSDTSTNANAAIQPQGSVQIQGQLAAQLSHNDTSTKSVSDSKGMSLDVQGVPNFTGTDTTSLGQGPTASGLAANRPPNDSQFDSEGAELPAVTRSVDTISRLLKERSTGAITLAATKMAQSAAGATSDAVNSSLRASNDKRDFAATLMQIPRLEDSVVTTVIAESSVELRRERAIFKENVLVVNSESSHSSGVDPKSGGLSLAGGSSESATNTRSGEQSPGTYWISGDMKNAEMQLDGLGDGPVEVSISVHGNQAHVAFRTDESQTRDALEGAGGALRDMLHKEGMELSGVSIGTTASGDDSKQGRKHQPDSRALGREGFAVKFPVDAKSSVVARRVGGLDVFV